MKTMLLSALLLFLQHIMVGERLLLNAIVHSDGTIKTTALPDGEIDFNGFGFHFHPSAGPVFSTNSIPEWSFMTPGNADNIQAMAVFQGDLYVGGHFENAGGIPNADNLVRWDGCEWHPIAGTPGVWVEDLVVHNGLLYIGGYFLNMNGNSNADHIAVWDGSLINAVGNGLNSAVSALDVAPYGVVAAGWFSDAGGNAAADTIAIWNGTSWSEMGSGVDQIPNDIQVVGNDIYVGGAFTNAGGVSNTNFLARWDGNEWHAVGSGLNGVVSCMALREDELYIGGGFTNVGGNQDADNVVLWHENAFHNLGSYIPQGAPGSYQLCLSEDHLYVQFNDAIHQWDLENETWDEFAPDYPGLYFVNALELYEDGLFVGAHNGSAENGSLWRWGEPSVQIEIFGVPDTVCLFDPPLPLPTTQSGFTGNWSGPYVSNNIFDPTDNYLDLELIFTTDGPCVVTVAVLVDVIYYEEFYLDLPNTMCQTDPPLVLQEVMWGVSGEWSGEGVINSIFYPAGLSGNIYLTFTPDPGQCLNPITTYIEVSPWTVITITGVPDEVCESDDPIYLDPVQSGIPGYWWGEGVEAFTYFNPEGLSGTITLVFEPEIGECATLVTHDIIVTEAETSTISGVPDSLCQFSAPVSLPANQNGITGEWSGQGVMNNNFNPAGLIGLISLTFNPDPGTCAFSATTDIAVYIVTPQIAGIPSSLCVEDDPIDLPINQNGIQGNWSGPGVAMNMFDPAGQNGVVMLTFSPDAGQCAVSVPFTITVDSLSTPVISGVPSTICELASPIALPVNQNGFTGNWSGPGVMMNTFDPGGQYGLIILIFTPDTGQCATSNTHNITVNAPVSPIITGVPSSLCEEVPPISLPTIQNGFNGNWAGPGVNSNTFNPDGQFGLIEIIYTPDPGQCAVPATHTIDVFNSIIPIISGVPTSLCVEASPIALPANQNGITGNWSGPGVDVNTFDPSGQNGLVELSFMPDTGQCAEEALHIIDVFEDVIPGITGVPSSLCENAPRFLLPYNQNGISGNWSGQNVSNNTFLPAGLNGAVTLVFTPDINQCANAVDVTINILPSVQVTPDLEADTLCAMSLPLLLHTHQDGFTGTWSGAGVVNDTFSPVGQQGHVVLTFTPDSGQCTFVAIDSIWVAAVVQPPIMDVPSTGCASDTIALPVVQHGITGTWSGAGVISNYFLPGDLTGVQTLFFTPDSGQCAGTAFTQIRIHEPPIAYQLNAVCDSSGLFYTISFGVRGGDSTSYTINGIPLIGHWFVSPPIPSDSISYAFVLDDAFGCKPFAVIGTFNCACATFSGTMQSPGQPLRICIGPRFHTQHNEDHVISDEEALWFVLHANAGNQLGNVLSMDTIPRFQFGEGMIPGQLYYVSAIAGSLDSNGVIDLHDPCLSVSPGVPVIFEVCDPEDNNEGLQPIDRAPFAGDAHGEVRNAINIPGNAYLKTDTRYSTLLIAEHDQEWLDGTWLAFQREDPMAVITSLALYDLWGRRIFTRQDVPVSELISGETGAIEATALPPGYYVLVAIITVKNSAQIKIITRYLVQ